MDLDSAFGPDVSPNEFFENVVGELYDAYKADVEDASQIDVIISVFLEDIGERWTVHHDRMAESLTVENDEMIDFPLISLFGQAHHWDRVKTGVLPLAKSLEARREELRGKYALTEAFRDDFERLDGVVELAFSSGSDEPMTLSIVLNNYEADDWFPRIRVELPYELLEDVVRGKREPGEAIRGLNFSGDRGFALELGGLLATHFDRP